MYFEKRVFSISYFCTIYLFRWHCDIEFVTQISSRVTNYIFIYTQEFLYKSNLSLNSFKVSNKEEPSFKNKKFEILVKISFYSLIVLLAIYHKIW